MIDIHTHLGRLLREDIPVTVEELIENMNKWGVEKAVVLPLDATPEGSTFWFTTEQVLEVYRRYPGRIIPFCKLDPRQISNSPKTDFRWILQEYKDLGCRGVGEITANLYIDDPMVLNLFAQCGELDMPVLFHLVDRIGAPYGLVDDIHLPRLERTLKELPETVFIGHAMSFWAEISADVSEETRGGYPKGPITKPGRLQELLRKYDNLYGDLSAGSGFNAITRDPEYGYKFLEEFQDKLLFGTDFCHHNQEVPIVDYIKNASKEGKISKTAYEKIT
ncbi:MAG: amidohydrolase family protein, partial [bacterium]|nr:amidohydrolase family protein [bacterium]